LQTDKELSSQFEPSAVYKLFIAPSIIP